MSKTIKLPGLIDPHVHFRDPGQNHKEDFYSGTSAALAGGFTTVIDMPNNLEPITTLKKLEEKITTAKSKTVCDIGFHFGTLGDNFDEFEKVINLVLGLKIYLNVTTGNFIIDAAKLKGIYKAWPGTKPILLHAEADVLPMVVKTLEEVPRQTHICHVSSKHELEFIIGAKHAGLPITCGVTPHHLFLTNKDVERLGPYGLMKPPLVSKADQDFLWANLDAIDIFESDHAPHTEAEKKSENPPFGVPGLETTLPLMLTAVEKGKLSLTQLIDRLHNHAATLFNIKEDNNTFVLVSMDQYKIKNKTLHTKSGWTPFANQTVVGKVEEVVVRGKTVYQNGQVLIKPGEGTVLV